MKSINRSVVIITPKQPYIDWLHSLKISKNKYSVELYKNDGGAYLVEDINDRNDVDDILKQNYQTFFERELSGIEPDKKKWPAITFELFHKWFDFHYHTVVFDIALKPLMYDDI